MCQIQIFNLSSFYLLENILRYNMVKFSTIDFFKALQYCMENFEHI